VRTDTTLSFQETVRKRKSVRSFLSRPVPDAKIREVLEDAQCTPSNANTQPWSVHIVSGEKLRQLTAALHDCAFRSWRTLIPVMADTIGA